MASDYRVATGHDVALVSLNVINPQPAGGGVMVVQRNIGADGTVHEIGKWARLEWNVLDSATEYLAVLTAFGLHNALTASVTVYIRNEFFAYARYNATATRPQMQSQVRWENFFPRDISIILKELEAL